MFDRLTMWGMRVSALLLVLQPWSGIVRAAPSMTCTVAVVSSPDSDGDDLTDANEAWLGTNPHLRDTDDDGLEDGEEYLLLCTSPTLWDTDDDGMPDGWEIRRGLDACSGEGDAGSGGDPDRDGFPNLSEWIADTNPQDKLSLLAVVGLQSTGEHAVIDWIGGTSVQQILEYRPEVIDTHEVWLPLFTNPAPTEESERYEDPDVATQRFYRIRVSP